MSLTIPFTFVAATKAKASEVNANFAAVAAKFSEGAGGILDEDVSTTAAIKGTKLSNTPGNRIPTDRLEDEAVTDVKLANDVVDPGLDSGRAVSGDHIKALTAAQLARFLPNTPLAGIGSNKIKFTFHEVPLSFTATGSGQPSGDAVAITNQAANPTLAFAVATYALVGLYIKDPVYAGGTILMSADATGSGTNWAGFVRALNSGTSGVAITCGLVYVFAQKT